MSASLLGSLKNADNVNDIATVANGANQLVISADPNSPLDPKLNKLIAGLSVAGAATARRARSNKSFLEYAIPQLDRSIFMSDALVDALKAEGFGSCLSLASCKLLDQIV